MHNVGQQAREPETALHPTIGLGIHSVVPVVFLEGSRGPKTPHPPPLHLQNTHTVCVSCTNETVLTSFRRTADRVPDRIATPPKAISDPAAGYWQQHTLETLNRDSWGGAGQRPGPCSCRYPCRGGLPALLGPLFRILYLFSRRPRPLSPKGALGLSEACVSSCLARTRTRPDSTA